jgi:hypothetical protein
LYGCETVSLTLKEEYALRVFQNRVLRRIFGQKMDEIVGDWRKLHDGWLHNLYFLLLIGPKGMRWAGHIACTGDK